MSLQSLLESANPYQSLQGDAARLAKKWEKTGLLEGLESTHKNNMGLLLENQAKQLVVEANQTGGGVVGAGFTAGVGEQWAGIALPLVRKVFGQISAKEFVSVQPMNLPSGLVFYLDFQYGTSKSPFVKGQSLYGATGGNLPFGNTNEGGLYGAGRFSYSINNTSSVVAASTGSAAATWAQVGFDSAFSASAAAGSIKRIVVPFTSLPSLDVEGVRAFTLSTGSVAGPINLPQFTEISGSNVVFYTLTSVVEGGNVTIAYQLKTKDNNRGDFEDKNNNLNGGNTPISIPEINIQMRSSDITAKTRKLKAVWTPEFAQDLNAYQNVDAEAELTSMLSEYISLEIDLEILDMLITNASAGVEYWSAVNNQAINANESAFDVNLGFFNSQGQWFQTLGTKIQKLSNTIHQKTLRGGANFMVVSPAVSTIIESIPGFSSDHNGDVEKSTYAFGVQKAGNLGGTKIKVYKNPYMTENQILLGFRGTQFLEAGAVFAPYIPLIMTPLVYDPETFTPRKGLLTRYGKKILRPEFYGLIKIAGLNTL
jgi:hypothetical protein